MKWIVYALLIALAVLSSVLEKSYTGPGVITLMVLFGLTLLYFETTKTRYLLTIDKIVKLARGNNKTEALELLDKLNKKTCKLSEKEANLQFAVMYKVLEMPDKSIDYFTRIADSDVSEFDKMVAYGNIIEIHYEKGDYAAAQDIIVKALALNANDWGLPYEVLGKIFQSKGDYDNAMVNYVKAKLIYTEQHVPQYAKEVEGLIEKLEAER